MSHYIKTEADRQEAIKALGNGLVWQIPYEIGKAIIERDAA